MPDSGGLCPDSQHDRYRPQYEAYLKKPGIYPSEVRSLDWSNVAPQMPEPDVDQDNRDAFGPLAGACNGNTGFLSDWQFLYFFRSYL